MKHRIFFIGLAILVLAIALASSQTTTSAQSGGTYDLTWNTIDGGGGMFSTGGNYSLGGTIWQPDAYKMSGGVFSLSGGFWGEFANPSNLFLPFIRK